MPAYLVLLQMEVTAFHVHTRKCLLVSVALFLALGVLQHLLRTAVSRHPALCSPDFPLPDCGCNRQRLSGQLSSALYQFVFQRRYRLVLDEYYLMVG